MIARTMMPALIFLLSGCQTAPTPSASQAGSLTSVPASSASPVTPASAASEVLDRLDARTPVPLLPMMAQHQKQNMRDHLVVVQEVVAALAHKDFTAIEKSAARMGYSETMGQMCTHMGAGAAGFTETALAFHRTADKIGAAANRREADAVQAALAETLSACTACHARYKQRIVDEATWAAVTGSEAPSHPPHP